MLNTKVISKKYIRNSIVLIIGVLLLLTSSYSLFVKGPLSWSITQLETKKMLIELVIYGLSFVFIGHIFHRRLKILASFILILIYSYSHYMLLPLIFVIIYIIQLNLLGNLFRRKLLKFSIQNEAIWIFDIILGSSLNIILFALLSLIGIGSITTIQISVCIILIVCVIRHFVFERNTFAKIISNMDWLSEHYYRLIIIILFLLITIGRAAIAIDFDSAWYGLRSPYVLNNGNGIYENLNLVGLVYTYPKGFEILTLPLNLANSYGFQYAFNIALTVGILVFGYYSARMFINEKKSLYCCILIVSIPGITNMATTAKSDIFTLFIQAAMVYFSVLYVKINDESCFNLSIFTFILSLALKPTSVVFSGLILFPLMLIRYYNYKSKKVKKDKKSSTICIIAFFSLFFVWLRTFFLVGIPATMIWTKVFTAIGFKAKYPYDFPDIGKWIKRPELFQRIIRIKEFFLSPISADSSHIIIAWGTILCTFFMGIAVIYVLTSFKSVFELIIKNTVYCYISLIYLFQFGMMICYLLLGSRPDGNYFMLWYYLSMIYLPILVLLISRSKKDKVTHIKILIIPFIIFCFLTTCTTNWSWVVGVTPINWKNIGFYDNTANNKTTLLNDGMSKQMYEIMSSSPDNRVIMFAELPLYTLIPCVAERFREIEYLGNENLVVNSETFSEYLKYFGCNYIYIQKDNLKLYPYRNNLVNGLKDLGLLSLISSENGNLLFAFNSSDNSTFIQN